MNTATVNTEIQKLLGESSGPRILVQTMRGTGKVGREDKVMHLLTNTATGEGLLLGRSSRGPATVKLADPKKLKTAAFFRFKNAGYEKDAITTTEVTLDRPSRVFDQALRTDFATSYEARLALLKLYRRVEPDSTFGSVIDKARDIEADREREPQRHAYADNPAWGRF